jgi:hypothetical protein
MKRRTKKEQGLIDFATRKSMHICLTTGTHSKFRIACFKHNVSMQEILEEFARRVGSEQVDAISILEDVALQKLNKEIRKYDNNDTDTLFDIIAFENPIRND